MFKKSLIAVAALSALAGSAMAADVQIYGRIDTGLRLTGVNYDQIDQSDETNFEMASGNYTGSRVGIKGSEDLGNGMTVGFVLENGFDSDTGAQKYDGLFGREAIVYLEGDFGKIAAGKMGILNGTAGSFAIGGGFNPFGTGWGEVGSQSQIWGAGFESRYNNMISYVTPDFAGVKVYAQYSFGGNFKDGKVVGEEGKTTTNRYYGLGVTYTNGGLNLVGIVDSVNEAQGAVPYEKEDTFRVTIGGSYDFGVVKPYLAAAYFKDGQISDPFDAHKYASGLETKDWEGFGVTLGATAPLFGGKAHAMVGYMDAEGEDTENDGLYAKDDFTRWLVGFGYEYSLSKRTTVYADAGYFKDEYKSNTAGFPKDEPDAYQAAVGLVHYF